MDLLPPPPPPVFLVKLVEFVNVFISTNKLFSPEECRKVVSTISIGSLRHTSAQAINEKLQPHRESNKGTNQGFCCSNSGKQSSCLLDSLFIFSLLEDQTALKQSFVWTRNLFVGGFGRRQISLTIRKIIPVQSRRLLFVVHRV